MPDADMSFEQGKVIFGENLGDQPHFLMELYFAAVGDGDAGAFLSPVLEGKKGKKDKPSYIYFGRVNPEDATALAQHFLAQIIIQFAF